MILFFNLHFQILKMNLNPSEWKTKQESDSKALCLDVRTKDEFDEGHLKDSINVDFYNAANFIKFLHELDKKKSYYVYCRSGKRSLAACEIMTELGFSSVFNLESGYLGWIENGYEIA